MRGKKTCSQHTLGRFIVDKTKFEQTVSEKVKETVLRLRLEEGKKQDAVLERLETKMNQDLQTILDAFTKHEQEMSRLSNELLELISAETDVEKIRALVRDTAQKQHSLLAALQQSLGNVS